MGCESACRLLAAGQRSYRAPPQTKPPCAELCRRNFPDGRSFLGTGIVATRETESTCAGSTSQRTLVRKRRRAAGGRRWHICGSESDCDLSGFVSRRRSFPQNTAKLKNDRSWFDGQ